MYVEYCLYNKYIEDYSIELDTIFRAIDAGIDGVAVPIHLLRKIKPFMPNDIALATAIDYPLGYSSSKVKINATLDSVKCGASAIDYVANNFFLKNDFPKLEHEIKNCIGICKDYGATFRIFLEYNRSNLKDLIPIVKMYYKFGADACFPTIGYHHDDFMDNIINGKILEHKTNMPIIFNGFIWKKDQFKKVLHNNFFGIRLYNLNFLV